MSSVMLRQVFNTWIFTIACMYRFSDLSEWSTGKPVAVIPAFESSLRFLIGLFFEASQ